MDSSNIRTLQNEVISYVDRSKGGILTAARNINPKITAQDLEDLVSEGYVIALEIVASGDIEKLEDLFWSKLKRSVWDSYEYIFDFNYAETYTNDDEEGRGDKHPVETVSAEAYQEKCAQEREFVTATASVLDFLSASEKRVLCLVLGLTSRGCCGVTEAAKLMGVTRVTARRLYDRILAKVEIAIRHKSQDCLVLSRGKPHKTRRRALHCPPPL